jgi:hypothetical protein
MGKIKKFNQFVNETYSILEGKEHKFADQVYRKISDDLSDLYDISDKFYGDIIHMAISYFDKNKEDASVDKFISSQKDKLDKLIETEKKKSEKQKKKDLLKSKGKDYENEEISDEDLEDEDEE